jgi:hypothetical protein
VFKCEQASVYSYLFLLVRRLIGTTRLQRLSVKEHGDNLLVMTVPRLLRSARRSNAYQVNATVKQPRTPVDVRLLSTFARQLLAVASDTSDDAAKYSRVIVHRHIQSSATAAHARTWSA